MTNTSKLKTVQLNSSEIDRTEFSRAESLITESKQWDIEQFIVLLRQETELFRMLAQEEQALQQTMIDRQYHLVEKHIEAMAVISQSIERSEDVRDRSFKALSHGNFSVSALIESLESAAEREALSSAYRSFKIAVLQVRSLNEGIVAFTSSQLETMEAVLNEAYPSRKGATYTSQGKRQNTAEPLVLDRSL